MNARGQWPYRTAATGHLKYSSIVGNFFKDKFKPIIDNIIIALDFLCFLGGGHAFKVLFMLLQSSESLLLC